MLISGGRVQSTIAIKTVGDSLVHLIGSFMGPSGTPYEGASVYGWARGSVELSPLRLCWSAGGRFEVDIHVRSGPQMRL